MRKIILTLLCASVLLADEAIDKKSGITLTVAGTAGTDYVVEYTYHNPGVFDLPTIYLKSGTTLSFANNARNVSSTTGRPKFLVGAGAGTGQIRYAFDMEWSRRTWSANAGTPYPLYSAPFTISSISANYFGSGQNLIGGTGGNGETITNRSTYFWKGILDSVGDEWHVLKYANDDSVDFPSASGDAMASDGKWVNVVLNPVTPALKVAASDGTGQFYTTPAKAYFTPVIHAQTTYIQGNCTLTLTNINGGNISYDLNGGSAVDVGAATVTLTQSDFSSGANTLRYWYTSTPSVKRTRIVHKNPAFVSGETHGNLVWYDATGYSNMVARLSRAPYSTVYANFSNKNSYFTGQSDWATKYNTGDRLGGQAAAIGGGPASNNSVQARILGNSATASGASLTYAEYAKQMMLDSGLTVPDLGMELSWTSTSQASSEVNYRGYWDVGMAYSAAVAYDWAAAYYRSDQHASGMTPVEERFIRDRMAQWAHKCALVLGDFTEQGGPGMWGTSWNVGATMIALALPSYSSAYYGTSGMDGGTTTYSWAPYQTTNYTWKQLFVTHAYSLGSYPSAPVHLYGWEGSNDDSSLVNFSGQWTDRRAYAGDGQMGANLVVYRNLQALYSPATSHTYLDDYLDKVTQGTAYYLKAEDGDVTLPYGPFRWSAVGLLNANFPDLITNSRSYAQGLSSGDDNSDDAAVSNLSLWTFAWYDDGGGGGGGGDVTAPTVAITSPSGDIGVSATPYTALAGTASDDTAVTSVTWSNSAGGSGRATGTTSWSVASITLQSGANVISVTSHDAAGNNSSTATRTITYNPPSSGSTQTHTNPRNRLGF